MSNGFPHELLANEERLYAFQENNGRVALRFGKPRAAGEESLYFRKFHFPRQVSATIWRDFLESSTWNLKDSLTIKHRDLRSAPPIAAPLSPREESKATWVALCKTAETALRGDIVQKLVPARKVSFAISPAERKAILSALPERLFFPPLENSFRFLVKSRSSIFFGATPEILFRREEGMLHVPAIAGTRSLSSGFPESTLREELLSSQKDRAEHAWVVDGIRENLQKLGFHLEPPTEPQVLRVPRLLHLYTPIAALDKSTVSTEALIECLHPTAAIAGYPKAEALDLLIENEGWDRGLFSAPLLFRTPGRELCLVAIRSALLTPEHIHFFAGAGYVRGSTPETEWEETERKIQVMQTILFGEAHGRK